MKLYVSKIVNHGELKTVAETDNEQTAIVNFHNTCSTLWNTAEVYTGNVAILDEQLNIYKGYTELIKHPEPEPEPEPEQKPEQEPEPEEA